MSRYIDADSIRRRVKEKTNPYGKPTLDYESGVKVLEMIDNEPTADVVEVRHGRWIRVESSDMATGIANKCSECGKMRYGSWLAPYCAVCGAKMDGERKD